MVKRDFLARQDHKQIVSGRLIYKRSLRELNEILNEEVVINHQVKQELLKKTKLQQLD